MKGVTNLLSKAKEEQWSEVLIDMEAVIMSTFGFIPIEEFKKEPVERMINLMKRLPKNKDMKGGLSGKIPKRLGNNNSI